MKKVVIVVVGSLLFIAGYNYTRRQAEYSAVQNTTIKPTQAKILPVFRLRASPTLEFSSYRGHV